MRILVTNDDGINAPGLKVAEAIARTLCDDVWIVAPEQDQSGVGRALSLSDPLRARKIGEQKYAVKGTPTDCVIMAVRNLMPEPPDLVLSGVNSGRNIADDLTFSGTVAAAMEATFIGLKAIALSQGYYFGDGLRNVPWQTAEAHGPELVKRLLEIELPEKSFLNVNFPNCQPDSVEGVEVVRQGALNHGLEVRQEVDGRGYPYYWVQFNRTSMEETPGTDVGALAANRITVTALKTDFTDYETNAKLAAALEQG